MKKNIWNLQLGLLLNTPLRKIDLKEQLNPCNPYYSRYSRISEAIIIDSTYILRGQANDLHRLFAETEVVSQLKKNRNCYRKKIHLIHRKRTKIWKSNDFEVFAWGNGWKFLVHSEEEVFKLLDNNLQAKMKLRFIFWILCS